MEHTKELEELHKQSLTKFHDYLSTKDKVTEGDQEKLKQLKDDWDIAWNKLMENLLVLERLEI